MRIVYGFIILLVALPIPVGLLGTLLPSFYYFPALGESDFSLQAYAELWNHAGIFKSIMLTLTLGWGATLLSLSAAVLLLMGVRHKLLRPSTTPTGGGLSLFLSVPHSAFAIGFLFLLMPSGWLLRLLSPWLTGYQRPPTDWLLPDIYGVTALVGLSLKEVPFLLLVFITACKQIPADNYYRTALCLGYSPHQAWLKSVFPHIYRRSRLAIFAVLAYSLSVVDVALILSPSAVPVLSAQVLRWSSDSNTDYYFLAAAAAVVQFLLIVLSFIVWRVGEKIASYWYRQAVFQGCRRLATESLLPALEKSVKMFFIIASIGAIATLPLFSLSHRWRFPDSLPGAISLRHWKSALTDLPHALFNSLSMGLLSALLGLLLVVVLLEIQSRAKTHSRIFHMRKLLFLPLLLPQVAFLLGVQILLLQTRMPIFVSVLLCHLLFVIPYVVMVLGDSYMNYDARNSVVGKTLGRSPVAVFVRIKLGLLAPSLMFAFAVGFAVSIGQYLPTIFAGAGLFTTLTTSAVTYAAGGNSGTTAVFALGQSLLPLTVFWLCVRNSKGGGGGGGS